MNLISFELLLKSNTYYIVQYLYLEELDSRIF